MELFEGGRMPDDREPPAVGELSMGGPCRMLNGASTGGDTPLWGYGGRRKLTV